MRERSEGTRGVVVAVLGGPGKQEVAGEAGGGRGGVGARHRAASVRGEEVDRGLAVAGWAASWGWARWAEVSAR